MNTKRRIVLIVSLLLCICVVGLGFWLMTEPQQDAGSWEEKKQCREYQEQLDKLKKYNLFWTSFQRRWAYSSCIKGLVERHNQPEEDHPISN